MGADRQHFREGSLCDHAVLSGRSRIGDDDAEPPPVEVAPEPPVVVAPPSAPALETCYERCLPLLLQELREERGTKDLPALAKKLGLLTQQLAAWLTRTVAEGVVKKERRKQRVRYVAADVAPAADLFQRGDDTA